MANSASLAKTQHDGWNDSLSGDYLWSNVNFGEAVTEVMTPLTGSVIRFTLDDWVFLPGMATVGIIGGRPYLNISIFATLFYGMRRSREDLLRFMEATLYMRLPADMPIPRVPVGHLDLLRGMVHAVRVQRRQQKAVPRTPAYVEGNRGWFDQIRARIATQDRASGLLDLWHSDMRAHIKEGVWCVLGTATHSAEYSLNLRRKLAEAVGPDDADTLIANASEADAPMDSLGPLVGLAQLARGEISRAEYFKAYGHRGPQEFELSVPRPAEDPAWLDQELVRIRRSPLPTEALLAKQRQAYERAWERLEARPSRLADRFGPQIEESARRARLRERARSAYVRDRWAVRLFALRAGELAGLGDEVFYLTLDELLALLSGDRAVTQTIEPRREAYQRYRSLPPYPPVIRGRFDPFAWAADPGRPTDIFDATTAGAPRDDPAVVSGSAGSAGVAEGIVRIVRDPKDGDSLREGEILVAVQTDIAWTLLFPRAAAVVTDIGAPLSHAAIVARELGIPAVVGCGNATAVLETGERVRVDGGLGLVERMGK